MNIITTFEMREFDSTKNGEATTIMKPVRLATDDLPEKVYESKNQAADVIFREVTADESIEKPRAEFIARCMSMLNLSKPGGSTYYHNKQKKAKGEPEFQFNLAANKKAFDRKREEKELADQTEEVSTEEAKEILRWQVALKDSRMLVESFAKRDQAQLFNKQQKAEGKSTCVIDKNKEQAKVA